MLCKVIEYFSICSILLVLFSSCDGKENLPSGNNGNTESANIELVKISLDSPEVSMKEGQTLTLSILLFPENAFINTATIGWSSSEETIVQVTPSGRSAFIKGISPGTADVIVRIGSLEAKCKVTILNPIPDAIDLGLSVKWASFNVGAYSADDCGEYYAWGETEEKENLYNYTWTFYKWGGSSSLIKYCTSDNYWGGDGTPDNKTILDPEDDVAHVKLGGNWRMPTYEELQELRQECTWIWTSLNGMNGFEVYSKINNNSIFLPAAGYFDSNNRPSGTGVLGCYWSSSLREDNPSAANRLDFDSKFEAWHYTDRFIGRSVRAVSE